MHYPGCRGFFPCCLRRKLSGEAAIVTSGKKNRSFPLVTIAALPLNFRRKQQEKKPSGTQGTNASQLFQNLNWKNLSTQRDIQKALMAFKSLNVLAPED